MNMSYDINHFEKKYFYIFRNDTCRHGDRRAASLADFGLARLTTGRPG
jgi:hypothetical protein